MTPRHTVGPEKRPPQEKPRQEGEQNQLTGGEVPVVVDDGVQEVGLPGVFRVPHRPVIEEDVLVGP